MISDAITVRLVESLSPAECQTLFGRQIQPGHQTRVLARTITLSRMLRYLANRHLYPDFEWLSEEQVRVSLCDSQLTTVFTSEITNNLTEAVFECLSFATQFRRVTPHDQKETQFRPYCTSVDAP